MTEDLSRLCAGCDRRFFILNDGSTTVPLRVNRLLESACHAFAVDSAQLVIRHRLDARDLR